MVNLATTVLIAFGMLTAFIGIGADYLLPNTAPGINLQQLITTATGLIIAFVAIQMRREKTPTWLGGSIAKRIATVLIITFVTLLALELALRLRGAPTYFSADPPHNEFIVSPWSSCDEAGCHYVQDAVLVACDAGLLEGRVCEVNMQGYSDADDFLWDDRFEDMSRVLLLGDSFTFGMSAEPGKSFAERLDAELSGSVIWNTGIPGSGTHQALASFTVYAPILEPQLTILGFYVNDFDDNLMPVDSWLNVIGPDGKAVAIRLSVIDQWENVIRYDLSDIEYIRSNWKVPPTTEVERQLGLTQLGTLLLRLLREPQIVRATDARFEQRERVTRHYLQDLLNSVRQHGSQLLILLIPGPSDISNEGMRYQLARDIVTALEIPFIDPVDLLEVPEDYTPPPDDHWSNAGHQKIGGLLADCLTAFFASGKLSDCAHVTMTRS